MRKAADNRRDANVSHHLEGKHRTKDNAGVSTS
jgi:hypothetical protein